MDPHLPFEDFYHKLFVGQDASCHYPWWLENVQHCPVHSHCCNHYRNPWRRHPLYWGAAREAWHYQRNSQAFHHRNWPTRLPSFKTSRLGKAIETATRTWWLHKISTVSCRFLVEFNWTHDLSPWNCTSAVRGWTTSYVKKAMWEHDSLHLFTLKREDIPLFSRSTSHPHLRSNLPAFFLISLIYFLFFLNLEDVYMMRVERPWSAFESGFSQVISHPSHVSHVKNIEVSTWSGQVVVRWCAFCQHAPVAKESRYATRSSTFRRSKKVRIVVDATVTFLTLKPLRLERQGFQVFSTWTHHWKPKTAPAKPGRKKKKHPILSVQCQAHIRFAYVFKKHIFDTWCVPSPSTSKAKSLEGNGEMFPLVASACKTKTRFAHMRIELI